MNRFAFSFFTFWKKKILDRSQPKLLSKIVPKFKSAPVAYLKGVQYLVEVDFRRRFQKRSSHFPTLVFGEQSTLPNKLLHRKITHYISLPRSLPKKRLITRELFVAVIDYGEKWSIRWPWGSFARKIFGIYLGWWNIWANYHTGIVRLVIHKKTCKEEKNTSLTSGVAESQVERVKFVKCS